MHLGLAKLNKGSYAKLTVSWALLLILNDILDLSQLSAGKIALHYQEFDLRKVVKNATEMFRAQVRQKGLRLSVQVASLIRPMVSGDPHRLRQILVNLIGNAVKFTHAGEIQVTVEQRRTPFDHPYLYFAVSDTGIGVPAERQEIIFERFMQADSTLTRRYVGTGLGLTICLQLVELMQGRIGVESIEGQGSTFFFTVGEMQQPSTVG